MFVEAVFQLSAMVAPRPELVHDPTRQPDGRIVQGIAQRQRTRALNGPVGAVVVEFLSAFLKALEFARRDVAHRVVLRLAAGRVVAVPADAVPAVVGGQPAGNAAPPIAALGAVALVAQPRHQLRDHLGHALRTPAHLARLVGEAKPRQ